MTRERDIWETFRQGSSPDGQVYRYRNRYIGDAAASRDHLSPNPAPKPRSTADAEAS